MEHKNIVATIYLKNGQAVKGMDNFEPMGWDVISLARLYNDSGIDKIIIFDLSDDDEEHEKNIHTIKNINRNVEIKVCAGGNISRFEDVKKFIYIIQFPLCCTAKSWHSVIMGDTALYTVCV